MIANEFTKRERDALLTAIAGWCEDCDSTDSQRLFRHLDSAAKKLRAANAKRNRPDCIGGDPYHGSDECPACNGSGEGGQAGEDHACGQCDGTGTIEGGLSGDGDTEECPVCDGTGVLLEHADAW